MTITFFLKNHSDSIEIPDPEFNPAEPEDSIYNPRYTREYIYPQLNLSNSNAVYILKLTELITQEQIENKTHYDGEILNKDVDEFTKSLTALIIKLEQNEINLHNVEYTLNKLKQLQRICYYAIGLNDSVIWC